MGEHIILIGVLFLFEWNYCYEQRSKGVLWQYMIMISLIHNHPYYQAEQHILRTSIVKYTDSENKRHG